MNGFWNRRLPALLLALIMVLSLTPAALATGVDGTGDSPSTVADHEHTPGALIPGLKDGQHQYQCAHEGCQEIVLVDHHYSIPTEIPNDDANHTLKCDIGGCTGTSGTEAHSYIWVDAGNGNHQQRCTECNHIKSDSVQAHNYGNWSTTDTQHSGECLTCKVKNEGNHSFTYTNLNDGANHRAECGTCGKIVTQAHSFDPSTNKCVCGASKAPDTWTVTFMNGTATVSTVNVNKGSALTSVPTASKDGYTFKYWSTTQPNALSACGGEANANVTTSTVVTSNTTYYAIFQASSTAQNVAVNAGTTNGKVVGSDIYTQINNAFRAKTGRDLSSVTFSNASSASTGVLYGNSSMGSAVNGTFAGSGLTNLYFVPGAGGTYTINYSAVDAYSNTVSGVLTIAATANTKIAYSAAPGKSVLFKDADFFTIFKGRTGSSDLRYVTFSFNENEYNNFDGSIYAGSNLLNKDNLKGGHFYYTDSREGDYSLSSLRLQVDNGARSSKLTLNFTAYGVSASSSNNVSASGTVELTINGAANGEVIYEVAPGGKVSLVPEDFNNAYQSLSGTNRTIRYVAFNASSSYASFNGSLICGSEIFSQRDLSYDKITFYYGGNSNNYDYDLGKVEFSAGASLKDGNTLSIPFRAYYSEGDYQTGTLKIVVKGNGGDVSYGVLPGQSVAFDSDDFNRFFRKTYPGYTVSYILFDLPAASALAQGSIYYDYGKTTQTAFTRTSLDDERFYYNPGKNDYSIDGLSFVAGSNFKDNAELTFTAYGTGSRNVSGKLVITSSDSTLGGDVSYKVAPGQKVDMKRTDFNTFFRKNYDYTLNYIVFSRPDSRDFDDGAFYVNYGGSNQTAFTYSSFGGKRFYYNSANAGKGDYYLDDLSFVAGSGFQKAVSFSFTAYDSDNHYVEGKLTISPDGASITTSGYTGSIRYSTTIGANLQINANDIARYYAKAAPGQTLQYVTLTGVPATGALYYNYYGASSYGVASRTQITSANFSAMALYHSPASSGQYSLTELTYVPSGTNYCATIPFIAYGTGSAVSGAILISVNSTAVPEVYGVVQRNGAIDLPASSIYNAILAATGTSLSGIQLLSLPAVNAGMLYLGSGTSTPANNTTVYTYAAGPAQMSLLRFIPAANYTGSVEIPYVALSSTGAAIASGTFSIGVVGSVRSFTDMSNSTWCYKYVTELSDASVISGYTDGSFKPNSTVTYGAALKLIMRAAGYPEQAPTGKNVFSGYLDRARADGIITRSNVDLSAPITRLQVAQIAAGAMKLSTANLSSVKPFTDTSDVYVQALNAAGIVEGYFANGTSTFKPNNTLTRGQISAIVWRMNRYQK